MWAGFRPGKLNSQFIVTARMDFQIFSKISDFRLYTATIWHFSPTPSSVAIEGHGLVGHEFEPSISPTLLLVWNLNYNDRPPACKIKKSVTINCEFCLPRLKLECHSWTSAQQNGTNKSRKFVIAICQPMCSECTRIALKWCENQNFPGGACPQTRPP